MRIEMTRQISGTRNGVKWPEVETTKKSNGEVVTKSTPIDLPEGEAEALIEQGYARKAKAAKGKPKGEKATATPKGEKS